MENDKLSLIINTCEKFSDLWDAHIMLLEQNWPDRKIDTFLVTDSFTGRYYDGIKIISAGEGTEMPQRIAKALEYIHTEYVLVTLDDYFLITPIESVRINNVVKQMDELKLDYVRLFKRPNSRNKIRNSSLYKIDLWSKKDFNYQVNLYPGIWRKSFLEKTVQNGTDAWSYELTLSKTAREMNAKCAMSKGKEFEILDVVRKGQLLHKSARYLKKNGLYMGKRTIISWREEVRINIFTFLKSFMPQRFIDYGKRILRKCGYKFYSDYC